MKKFHFLNIYRIGLRYPIPVLFLATVAAVASLFLAKRLQVETDFSSLLPKDTPSVVHFQELQDSFGSMGFLYLTVEHPEIKQAENFAEQFVTRLENLSQVRYVDYRKPADYFKKRKWLFLDLADLKTMEQRVDRSLLLQEKGVSPVFSSLMDFADEEDRADLTFEDIRKKYQERLDHDLEKVDQPKDGEFLVLRVKPFKDAGDLEANQELIQEVEKIQKDLQAQSQFKGIRIGYAGTYKTSLETVELIRKEMAWVSFGAGLVLFLIFLLYFKKFSAAVLVGLPLGMGVSWTAGLLYLIFGKVNVLTAFSLSILAGLGSDYGIYLLDRFFKEIRQRNNFAQACYQTFTVTGLATFLAVLTTMAAFGSLVFSDFRIFVEFGTVGLIGLFLNFFAMILVLPALFALANRHPSNRLVQGLLGWHLTHNPVGISSSPWFAKIFSPIWARTILASVLVLLFLSSLTIPAQSRIDMETGQLDPPHIPSNQVYRKITDKLNTSLYPSIFLVQGADRESQAVGKLREFQDQGSKGQVVYQRVLGLSTFIPTGQQEKIDILNRLVKKYPLNKFVNDRQKEEFLASVQETLDAGRIHAGNLPEEITRNFVSSQKPGDFAIFLFPAFDRDNREEILRYKQGLVSAMDYSAVPIKAVDSSFINSDILNLIDHEASRSMIFFLIFLLGILFFAVRKFKRALLIFFNLLGSLILLLGLLYLMGIKLNVLNIVVIPIILGTGIDCFIHFSYHFDESFNLLDTIKTDIPPILFSNLTSIIGFVGLIFTSGDGLRSVGIIAVLGLSLVTLFCVFLFPRALFLGVLRHPKAVELSGCPGEVPTPKLVAQPIDFS